MDWQERAGLKVLVVLLVNAIVFAGVVVLASREDATWQRLHTRQILGAELVNLDVLSEATGLKIGPEVLQNDRSPEFQAVNDRVTKYYWLSPWMLLVMPWAANVIALCVYLVVSTRNAARRELVANQ